MEDKINKIRFYPPIIDHFSLIREMPKYKTDEDAARHECLFSSFKKLADKYNVHAVINDHIYLRVYKNGVPIDKLFRIKVDGNVYNKIMEACGNQLPRYIEIIDAETLDITEIY